MICILNTIQSSAATIYRTWQATSPRNLLAACKARDEYQRHVMAAYGNASNARTWVEVDGAIVDAGPSVFLTTADCAAILARLQ